VPEKEEDDEGDSLGNDFRDLLTGVLHAERMPTVEIDACVVRATPGQMMEACEFGDTNGIGVLNADESREVLQRLKDAGAEFLDRPRAVVQSAVNAKLEAVFVSFAIRSNLSRRMGRRYRWSSRQRTSV